MCGIVGATGADDLLNLVLAGLVKLEYRGYDSAGVALVGAGAGKGAVCLPAATETKLKAPDGLVAPATPPGVSGLTSVDAVSLTASGAYTNSANGSINGCTNRNPSHQGSPSTHSNTKSKSYSCNQGSLTPVPSSSTSKTLAGNLNSATDSHTSPQLHQGQVLGGQIQTVKAVGKLIQLEEKLKGLTLVEPKAVVGHTRWATHGKVTEANTHPHLSNDANFALVHNGIVENEAKIRSELGELGYSFRSQTDSELLVILLEKYFADFRRVNLEDLGDDAGNELTFEGKGKETKTTLAKATAKADEFAKTAKNRLDDELAKKLNHGLSDVAANLFVAREGKVATNELAELLLQGFLLAFRQMLAKIEGNYAILATSSYLPGVILGAASSSPLLLGKYVSSVCLASDAYAFGSEVKEVYQLADQEIVIAIGSHYAVLDSKDNPVEPTAIVLQAGWVDTSKGNFSTFMEKEIFDQPLAVAKTIEGRLRAEGLSLEVGVIDEDTLQKIDRITFVGCGSAAYSAMIAKYAIEHWCRIPVEVDLAHEFRYRDPVISEKTLVVAVSQSGETMDTIKAIEHARNQGAKVLSIVNTPSSTIARLSDAHYLTRAGREVAVASTKAFTSQVAASYLFGLYLAQVRGNKYLDEIEDYVEKLSLIPAKIRQILDQHQEISRAIELLPSLDSAIFLGRHVGYPVALEGALKLKEIAYLNAQAFAAGELKHGPIALIEPGQVVIIVVSTRRRPQMYHKVISAIEQVRARGAFTIAVTEEGDRAAQDISDLVLTVPPAPTLYLPLLQVIPLQLLALEVAKLKGVDIDQPRNLAKSVTVE